MKLLRNRNAASGKAASAHPTEYSVQINEAIVGGIIAILIEAVNIAYFHHSSIGVAVVVLTIVVSVLLAVMRHSLRVSFQETYSQIGKLAETVDLSKEAKFAELASLIREYVHIPEEEFRRLKKQILSDATEKLHNLAANKRSPTLPRNEYYAWLLPILRGLKSGDRIQAVSTSSDAEWDSSPEEKKFLEYNLEAAALGCKVQRIFVVDRSRIGEFLKIPAIAAHTKEAGKGLEGFVAYRNELESKAEGLLRRLGSGFLLINGRVALIDDFADGGDVRGVVTMDRGELLRFSKMFEEFLVMSEVLSDSASGGKPRVENGG